MSGADTSAVAGLPWRAPLAGSPDEDDLQRYDDSWERIRSVEAAVAADAGCDREWMGLAKKPEKKWKMEMGAAGWVEAAAWRNAGRRRCVEQRGRDDWRAAGRN